MKLNKKYWENHYQIGDTPWDVGEPTKTLKAYIDQIVNKKIKILIPGGGNAHELAYLHKNGFYNAYLLDISPTVIKNFKKKHPTFPKQNLIEGNFFEHQGNYDLILEQTFFCAIDRDLRKAYAEKVNNLLNDNGKLVGVFWSSEFEKSGPPYGGTKNEYLNYFEPLFKITKLEPNKNSIKPREGRELFMIAEKK